MIVMRCAGEHSGALAPLVQLNGRLNRLELLGVKHLSEPQDLLYSDSASLRELLSFLYETGSPLFLERVPADSATIAAIQEIYKRRGVVILRQARPFPRIVLSDDWRQPESRLNSGRRSDLRRAVRIGEQIGALSHEVLAPRPEELPPLLEEAFEIEAANWKGREGSAVARDELRGAFYRSYAAAASEAGILRLCFLRIGGRAVAMQLALESLNSFWLLKIGYREEFARCSPGMILIAESIRYAASKGLSSFEFLGTAEGWTRVWAKDERPSVSVRAYPSSVRGTAALAVDAVRAGCNRFANILRSLGSS